MLQDSFRPFKRLPLRAWQTLASTIDEELDHPNCRADPLRTYLSRRHSPRDGSRASFEHSFWRKGGFRRHASYPAFAFSHDSSLRSLPRLLASPPAARSRLRGLLSRADTLRRHVPAASFAPLPIVSAAPTRAMNPTNALPASAHSWLREIDCAQVCGVAVPVWIRVPPAVASSPRLGLSWAYPAGLRRGVPWKARSLPPAWRNVRRVCPRAHDEFLHGQIRLPASTGIFLLPCLRVLFAMFLLLASSALTNECAPSRSD